MKSKRIISVAFALLLAVAVPVMLTSCEKEENKPNVPENPDTPGDEVIPNQFTLDGVVYDLSHTFVNWAGSGESQTLCVKLFNEDTTVSINMFFHGDAIVPGQYPITESIMSIHQSTSCFMSIYVAELSSYALTVVEGNLSINDEESGEYVFESTGGFADGKQFKFYFKGEF